jgi:Arc/MetJ family transcription regulator
VRTTITLDDDLVAASQECTGIQEKSALVRAALKALVERAAARRLARLGGSAPDLGFTGKQVLHVTQRSVPYRHADAEPAPAKERRLGSASTSFFVLAAKTWMAGRSLLGRPFGPTRGPAVTR